MLLFFFSFSPDLLRPAIGSGKAVFPPWHNRFLFKVLDPPSDVRLQDKRHFYKCSRRRWCTLRGRPSGHRKRNSFLACPPRREFPPRTPFP